MNAAREFEAQVLPLLPRLRSCARQMTRSQESEDLVQDTLLRAWKAWGKYKVENVWGWLWLIMRNLFLVGRRNSGSRRDTTAAHLAEIAEVRAVPPRLPDAGITAGLDDQLIKAIGQLSPAQRSVIELQMMGFDDVSAAQHLQIELRTVRAASCKARAKIRALL